MIISTHKFRQRAQNVVKLPVGAEVLSVVLADAGFCKMDVVITVISPDMEDKSVMEKRELYVAKNGDFVPLGAKFIGSSARDPEFGRAEERVFFFLR